MGLSPLTYVLYRTKNQKYPQNKSSDPTEYFIRMFKFYSKGFGGYLYPVRNWNVSSTRARFSLFHLMSVHNDNHTAIIILCPAMKDFVTYHYGVFYIQVRKCPFPFLSKSASRQWGWWGWSKNWLGAILDENKALKIFEYCPWGNTRWNLEFNFSQVLPQGQYSMKFRI